MEELAEWFVITEALKKKQRVVRATIEEGIRLSREMLQTLQTGKYPSDDEEIKACLDLAHFLQARKLFREMDEKDE
jgi:hypothetical protein